jgi:hypothetical protein
MGLNEDLGDRENVGNASVSAQRAREAKAPLGAAFNALMEEETKESLAKLCCNLMDEIAVLEKDSTIIITTPFPFLHSDFLTLMNDIGRLGHEKFGVDAFEVAGGERKIERHQRDAIIYHARGHLSSYLLNVPHDKLSTVQAHLAAAAFNCMLEYIFSQGE